MRRVHWDSLEVMTRMLDVCERVDVDEIDITAWRFGCGLRSGRGLDHAPSPTFVQNPISDLDRCL